MRGCSKRDPQHNSSLCSLCKYLCHSRAKDPWFWREGSPLLETGQVAELQLLQIQSHFQCPHTCQGTGLRGGLEVEMDPGEETAF